MSEQTIVAWTDHTFNPVWGCEKVSAGCKNCYAERLAERYGFQVWGRENPRRVFGESHWSQPLAWENKAAREHRRHRVFCGSMCDIFEDHPTTAAELKKLWPLIRETPHLDWQLLTKRPHRIAGSLPADWNAGYPNVWLGTSIEDMRVAERADHLRRIPAAVRFISYEPALGPLDDLDLTGISWLIYGGESGPKHREHDLSWPRAMRLKCAEAGVAFFFKQSAAYRTETGITLDGETVREYPTPRSSVIQMML